MFLGHRDKDSCEFPFKFKLAAEEGQRLLETYVGVYITVGVSIDKIIIVYCWIN